MESLNFENQSFFTATDDSVITREILAINSIYGCTGVIGIAGNFFVIFLICKSSKLRSQNCFILIQGLAIADVIYSVTFFYTGILRLYDAIVSQTFNGYTQLQCLSLCTGFILGSKISNLTTATIAVERWIAVKYPIKYQEFTTKRAIYALLLIWCVSAASTAMAFAFMPNSGTEIVHICNTGTAVAWAYRVYWHFINVTIGLISLVFYVAIVKNSSDQSQRPRSVDSKERFRSLTVLTRCLIVAYFVFNFLPFMVNGVLFSLFSLDLQLVARLSQYGGVLLLANCLTNLFLYAIKNTEMRTEACRIIHCLPETRKYSIPAPQDPNKVKASSSMVMKREVSDNEQLLLA